MERMTRSKSARKKPQSILKSNGYSDYDPTRPSALLDLPPEIRRLIYINLGLEVKYRVNVIVDTEDLEVTNFIRRVTCREHRRASFSHDCFFDHHVASGDVIEYPVLSLSGTACRFLDYDHRTFKRVANLLLPYVDIFGVCRLIRQEAQPVFIAATEYYLPTWSMSEAFFRRNDTQLLPNLCSLHLRFGELDETFRGLPKHISLPMLQRLRVDVGVKALRTLCETTEKHQKVLDCLAETLQHLQAPRLKTFMLVNVDAWPTYGPAKLGPEQSIIDWLLQDPSKQCSDRHHISWGNMLIALGRFAKIELQARSC